MLPKKGCKTRYDWVEKVVHWELCKKFPFVDTNKWYMYNIESVLENETHRLLWDFEIQMIVLLISWLLFYIYVYVYIHSYIYRRADIVIVNKKKRTSRIVHFAVPDNSRVKLKESKKKDKYLDLARKPKKNTEHEGDGDTNCNWCTRYSHDGLVLGLKDL